ncbi:phosphoethanolamine transferase CptA [Kribbella sp. NBC_01484]|uniref:hypothetical protein n=1 Tax=Kribbella sp. NBC_01484 TaxID=2903579 RepID=UPI002E3678AF|nr:hypothetical protein [Kribbella sp. NBC_01484]
MEPDEAPASDDREASGAVSAARGELGGLDPLPGRPRQLASLVGLVLIGAALLYVGLTGQQVSQLSLTEGGSPSGWSEGSRVMKMLRENSDVMLSTLSRKPQRSYREGSLRVSTA